MTYREFRSRLSEARKSTSPEKLLLLEDALKEFLPKATSRQSWVGEAFADLHWDLDERGFYLRPKIQEA